MHLSKQTNYALRTLIYCASKDPEQSRIAAIAKAYDISELSLFKLIKPMVDNGYLETLRGRNGGVRLGKPASEITMGEIVRLTEENFTLAECFSPEDAGCPLIDNCDMNAALREALGAFLMVLEKYTIADLARRQSLLRELLDIAPPDPAAQRAVSGKI